MTRIPVLPSDVFLVIFGHLFVQDILNARQVDTNSWFCYLCFLDECLARPAGTFMSSRNREVFGIG